MNSTTKNPLEAYVENIEELCDDLRALRRESPESFFGQPLERLYDSLEAALGDFYRAGVSA